MNYFIYSSSPNVYFIAKFVNLDEERKRKRERKKKEKKEKEDEKKIFEIDLLKTIKSGNFEEIENTITPRALQKCDSDTLLLSMKVSFQLRRLADRKGPDEGRFNQLANSVEEFAYCLLDPLRSDLYGREQFGEYYLDFIMDDAIELSKKVVHPSGHK
ncbi:hypothetical protein OS493_012598 [Desmophyllum pertusum]|uniref:Uncharacterized protein n=1 Tax=Desmophyllum pertusum TaxID=174260 RepID=A0A9W9ZF57_9CNID|nr:hypothetical protein OS493_012598 [Desmophyllum pertusum]